MLNQFDGMLSRMLSQFDGMLSRMLSQFDGMLNQFDGMLTHGRAGVIAEKKCLGGFTCVGGIRLSALGLGTGYKVRR